MMSLILLMLTTLVLQIKTDDSLVLDNNQFLIYNKVYHKARLAQWGTDRSNAGTYEHGLYPDQLWTLDPHPTMKDCYYIVNERYSQHRIADSNHKFVVTDGTYYNDQLFKFVPNGDGFYYIYSCHYINDRITKHGRGMNEVSMYSGPNYSDQLWKLVPRFKANLYTNEVFHQDNRQGSEPIAIERTVTTGLRRSTTDTIQRKETFKQSIEASFSGAVKALDIGVTTTTEFSNELETSFSQTDEQNWSRTEKITFTIPAYKNYKVMQHVAAFEGEFSTESCRLLTAFKVFESDSETFDELDDFIISSVQ